MIVNFKDVDTTSIKDIGSIFSALEPYFKEYGFIAQDEIIGSDKEEAIDGYAYYYTQTFDYDTGYVFDSVLRKKADEPSSSYTLLKGYYIKTGISKSLEKSSIIRREQWIKNNWVSESGLVLTNIDAIANLTRAASLIKGCHATGTTAFIRVKAADVPELLSRLNRPNGAISVYRKKSR